MTEVWANGSGPPPTLTDMRAMARLVGALRRPRLRAFGTIGDLRVALMAGWAAGYEVREAGLALGMVELREDGLLYASIDTMRRADLFPHWRGPRDRLATLQDVTS